MKKEVKSQAALEFLTTYYCKESPCMIAVGALYYFGVFNFSKFLPQKCVFPSQFDCTGSGRCDLSSIAGFGLKKVEIKSIDDGSSGTEVLISEFAG